MSSHPRPHIPASRLLRLAQRLCGGIQMRLVAFDHARTFAAGARQCQAFLAAGVSAKNSGWAEVLNDVSTTVGTSGSGPILGSLPPSKIACNRASSAFSLGGKQVQCPIVVYNSGSTGDHTINFNLPDRITIESGKCGGQAYILGMRIRVVDVLEMLGGGVEMSEIPNGFPDLEKNDIPACPQFAARRSTLDRWHHACSKFN
jgi:uncharacterized protein (DUF433 family)